MINIIVAYAENRVIGREGRIPWSIKGEQRRFRELTMGHVVVMGRRTFEEIGRPLPGRWNIIISSTKKFEGEYCCTVASLAQAMELAGAREIYVAGGARLYAEALPLAEKLYITKIHDRVEGDTCFPEFDESDFIKVEEEHISGEIPYTYLTYIRKLSGQGALSEV